MLRGGPKLYTDRQTHTHTHIQTHTDRQTHTHTEAYFISLVFLRKCRNKTKKRTPGREMKLETRIVKNVVEMQLGRTQRKTPKISILPTTPAAPRHELETPV